jgi:hypothetical protein
VGFPREKGPPEKKVTVRQASLGKEVLDEVID